MQDRIRTNPSKPRATCYSATLPPTNGCGGSLKEQSAHTAKVHVPTKKLQNSQHSTRRMGGGGSGDSGVCTTAQSLTARYPQIERKARESNPPHQSCYPRTARIRECNIANPAVGCIPHMEEAEHCQTRKQL